MTTFPTLVCDGMGSVFLLDSPDTGVVIRAAFGTGWEEGKALTKFEVESRVKRCRRLPTQLVREHHDSLCKAKELQDFLVDVVANKKLSVVQVKEIMSKYGQGARCVRYIPYKFLPRVELEAIKVIEQNKQDKRTAEVKQRTIDNAIRLPVDRLAQSIWWLNRRWDEVHSASQCIGATSKGRALILAQLRDKLGITHLEAVQLCSALAAVYTISKGAT